VPDPSQIELARRTAGRWLLAQQHGESLGWGESPSRYANTINTAEGILGLLDADIDEISADPKLEGAAKYLEERQVSEGRNAGCWVRDVRRDDNTIDQVPDVTRTATALEALMRMGRLPTNRLISSGLEWLESALCPGSGGWGYGLRGSAAFLPTTRALRSLVEAKRKGWSDPNNVLPAQLLCLSSKRQPNGSFGFDTRLTAVNTIAVGILFQKARVSQVYTDLDIENSAIDWVKNSPDACVSPVVETIELDTEVPEATYEFIHIPDVFTLQLLADSLRDSDRLCATFFAAQLSLRDRIDPAGGVFGYRTYTWATSHALCAMSAVIRTGVRDFPTRHAESSDQQVPNTEPQESLSKQPIWRSTTHQIIALLVIFIVSAAFGIFAFALGGPAFGLPLVAYFVLVLGGGLVLIGRLSGQNFTDMVKSAHGHS
jgi:hypothetical protein